MLLHTQAEHGPVPFTGPSTFRRLSKTPLFRAGGRQGIRTQSLPCGRTGLRPVGGPSAPYRPSGDSARSRTRTHELWRLGCSRYTTLPTSTHVSTVSKTHTLRLACPVFAGSRPKQKRPSRGSP